MAAAAAVAVMIIMRMKRREGGPQKVLQPKDSLERTPHTRAHTRSRASALQMHHGTSAGPFPPREGY